TEAIAQRLGWREMGGLVVTVVDARGPAARGGVRSGDRIRRVNGRTTDTVEDAQASIYGSQVGDLLHLDLERAGKRMTLDVKLEEAPEH
ncbi:MAG: PDZ domain-containing protein, partial [Candidatus Eisenbacteria bacterium]